MTPTGTITFAKASGTGSFSSTTCSLAAINSTSANCSPVTYTQTAGAGSNTITAQYGGDTNHATSSGTAAITVNLRSSSTAISCNSPVVASQGSSCSVTVSDTAGSGATTPAGTVSFTVASGSGGFSPSNCTLSSGSCSVTFTPSASGTASVTGTYAASDSVHAASSGTSNTITVSPRSTSVAVACTSPVDVSQGSSCSVTVSDTAGSGATTPAGTVSFTLASGSGGFSPSSCTLSSGSCSVTFTPSASGTASVTGTYAASDSVHAASSGTSNTITVSPRSTSMAVSCSSPVDVSQGSSCSVTVSDTAGSGATTPAGTVSFTLASGSGGFSPSSCTLSSGSCSVTFTPSASGTASVTGTYAASDSVHAASSGTSNTITVNSAFVPTVISVSSTPIDSGQSSTLSTTSSFSGGSSPYTCQWLQRAPGAGSYSSLGSSFSCIVGDTPSVSTGTLSTVGPWSFELQVTDSAGVPVSIPSNAATVTVNSVLVAGNVSPSLPKIDNGQSITLSAAVSGGTGPYSYQWYTGSSSICSSDTTLLGTSVTQSVSPSINTYYCYTVTDSSTASPTTATSATDLVTVNPILIANAITPSSPTIDSGQNIVSTSHASGGTPSLTYQWYSGTACNTAISGATSSTFTAAPSVTTTYTYKVTDSANTPVSQCSAGDTVTVNSALIAGAITPGSPKIDNGQSVTLTANPSGGTPSYSYQWYTGSGCTTLISGATSQTRVATISSTTTYSYKVTDSANTPVSQCSAGDTVTVNSALAAGAITPSPATIDNGESIVLTSHAAGGTPSLSYQWYSDGSCTAPIASATSTTYAASPTSTTSYSYKVTDQATTPVSVCSPSDTVTVNSALVAGAITPVSSTIDSGQSVALVSHASGGTGSYTYQWFSTGACTSSISGATSATYTASPGFTTSYSYRVTDTSQGTPNFQCSSGDTVTVNPPLVVNTPTVPKSTIRLGEASSLSAAFTGGTSPYTCQWLQKAPGAGAFTNLGSSAPCTSPVSATSGILNTIGTWSFELQVTDSVGTPVAVISTPVNLNVLSEGIAQEIGGQSNQFQTQVTCTFGSNVASGDVIVVSIATTDTSKTVSSVTDTFGDSFSQVTSVTGTGAFVNQRAFMWAATVVSSGADTITITMSGGSSNLVWSCVELFGVSRGVRSVPPPTSGFSTSNSFTASVGSFTPTAGDFVYAWSAFSDCDGTKLVTYDPAYVNGTAHGTDLSPTTSLCNGTKWFDFNQADEFLSSASATSTTALFNIQNQANPSNNAGWVEIVVEFVPQISVSSTPVNPIINSGQTIILTASPSGGSGVYSSYQWYSNAACTTTISGATSASYPASPSSTTTYCVKVTDSLGDQATSTNIVTVNPSLSAGAITPSSPKVDNGQSITLTVNQSGGSSPYSYQWYSGAGCVVGSLISGATSSTYLASPTSSTTYSYKVTDSSLGSPAASSCSAGDTVTVNAVLTAGAITPPNPAIDNGQSITLTLHASGGTGPLSYQWYSDSSCTTSIPGAASSPYSASPAITTSYSYKVTDSAFSPVSVCSASDLVTVNSALAANGITPAAPTINSGDSITLTANPTGGTTAYSYQWYSGTSPTCSSDTNLLGTSSTQPVSPTSTTYYCYRVTDSANSPVSQFSNTDLVTVQDTTSPVMPALANVTAEATSSSGAVVAYTVPNASDAVDGPVPLVCSPASGSQFAMGSTLVTCTATDAHGNQSSGTFFVIVQDTTAPTLDLPGDITQEATGPNGAEVSFSVSATDIVDGSDAVVCSPASGSTFALGPTEVDCYAIDSHNNRADSFFDIFVVDTTPPVLSLPVNGTIVNEATGPSGAPATFTASASDIVDGSTAVFCSSVSGDVFPIRTTVVHCYSTDGHGNTSTGSFQVTIRDSTAPTLNLPTDITVEATGSNGRMVTFTASSTDIVDGSDIVVCNPASGSNFALGLTVANCSSTDAHGNIATGFFSITVIDTTPPVPTLPSNITAEASSADGAVVTFTASAVDSVDGPVAVNCTPASGSVFNIGVTEVDCSAEDAHHNTATGFFFVAVQDTTAPVVTVPGDITSEATGQSGAAVSFSGTAWDAVGVVSFSCEPASGNTFAVGSTLVTCIAYDAADNHSSATFRIIVRDTTAPTLLLPADITVEAANSNGAVVDFSTTATDTVDGTDLVICNPASGSTFAIGMTQINCYSIDAHGNRADSFFDIFVVDTTPPVVTVPSNVTAEATAPLGASVHFASSASDAVGVVSFTCTPASDSTFAIGTTAVLCDAADQAGNHGYGTFYVIVRDTTAPTLHLPSDITQEAMGANGAEVSFSVSATDIVDGSDVAVCSRVSGSTFALGATEVDCYAVDAHGNRADSFFDIFVVDTTPPVLSLPVNGTIVNEATGPSGAPATFTVSASDVVDVSDVVVCSRVSGSTFALGTTIVHCYATDLVGNTATGSFGVTVRDTTAPVILHLDDVSAEATGPNGAIVSYSVPNASDLVDGSVTLNCVPTSASLFHLGSTVVACTATDNQGNTSGGTFEIIVVDTTPPILTLPGNFTIVNEATGPTGSVVTFDASASDIVDGALSISCNPASGSMFPVGIDAVHCSATDAHDNTASGYFQLTVQDTTPPDVSVPADITTEATDASGAMVSFTASASDAVGVVSLSCTPASNSTLAIGMTAITCTAYDDAGNHASNSFSVTVEDTTPPVMPVLNNVSAEATGSNGAIVIYTVTDALDTVDGSVALSCSPLSGGLFHLGTTQVACTATDSHDNTSRGVFDVTVVDTTPPVLTLPVNGTIVNEATGHDGGVATFSVSASDVVDVYDAVICGYQSGDIFPITTTVVHCHSTDSAGNTSTGSFEVTVQDTTPPAIPSLANVTAEATDSHGAIVSYTVPDANDAVDGSDALVCTPASNSQFDLGTTPVTCTVTDVHGNHNSGFFDVFVVDTTPPVLHLPSDITAEASGSSGAIVRYTTSASDTVDGTDNVSCSPVSGTVFALGSNTLHCSATDAAGNIATGSFQVIVVDTTPPTLTLPGNETFEATSASGAAINFTVSASDIVDGFDVVVCNPASGSTFALGTTQVNCHAFDQAGNEATGSFSVTIVDTTPPVIPTLVNLTNEAAGPNGAIVHYTGPAAADLVDGSVTLVCSPESGSQFVLGPTTVGCTATDSHNNSAQTAFQITVEDTTPPQLSLSSNILTEATSPSGAVVSYSVTATDIVDGSVTPECTPISGSTFAIETTIVNCSATDAHGNTSTDTFKVTVKDTTPPTLTLPQDIVTEATGPAGAQVSFSTSATDIVDISDAVTCNASSGDTFAIGTTIVYCSTTDHADNTSSGSFNVTIVDTTAPVLSLPGNVTLEATSADGAIATFTATATDVVDGFDNVSCTPATGSTLAIGTTTIVCTAIDAHNNTSTGSFTVTVQDTTTPALHLPGNMTVEATGPSGASITFDASAHDLVNGDVTVDCSPPSGFTFPLGDTIVNCSASDTYGNNADGSFKVTVQDTTTPTVSVPATIIAEASGPSGATVTFSASAVDIVDGSIIPVCTPAPSSVFGLGTTTIICSGTDSHGNIGASSFNITVQDTTAPSLTLPSDMTREAAGPSGTIMTFTASASDAVDVSDVVTCNPASGHTFPLGVTVLMCTATDVSGNSASGSFQITVQDTIAPTLTVPGDMTSEATGPLGATVTYSASASDIFDGSDFVICNPSSGSTFSIGTTTVNCSASDANGNTSTSSFKVIVQDTTAPVITVPSSFIVDATDESGATVSYTASATDLVYGVVSVSCSPASGSLFPVGMTSVDCSASDSSGNTSTASFEITVNQVNTPPTLSLPANIATEATGPSGVMVTFTVTASDSSGNLLTPICSPASGSTFLLGTTTVDCYATDAHGNTTIGSFQVTVQDITPPSLALPQNIVVEAAEPDGAAVSYTASAFDLVDGSITPICAPASDSIFAVTTTVVNCSATDSRGNTASGSFNVVVQDTTPPTVSFPTSITVEATGSSGASVTFTATATDIVDGSVVVICSPPSGSTSPLGTTTVNCSATDSHGNTGHATFQVTVQDTTRPTLTLPSNIAVHATSSSGAIVTYSVAANDLVDGSVTPVCVPTSGSTFSIGTTTVTCTATDSHANLATGSFTVTVQDFTISASLTSIAANVKTAIASTITVSPVNGFTGTVNLSASVSPATGLTCTLSPTSLTLSSSQTSTLICVGTNAGTYTVTVNGASGSLTHSAIVTVNIRDFAVAASPTSFTVNATKTGASTITVSALNGFTGNVKLTLTVSPATGLTCTLSTTGITLRTTGTSTLSCTGSGGAYTVSVTGQSQGITHTATITYSVKDFTISANPTSISVNVGSPATSTITVAPVQAFTGTVTLTSTVSSKGLTCTLSPASIVLGTSGTSTLTCKGTSDSNYVVTITGTSGSIVHTTQVQVKIKQSKGSSIISMPTISLVSLGLTGLLVNFVFLIRRAESESMSNGEDNNAGKGNGRRER